jgi:hypothetical protein
MKANGKGGVVVLFVLIAVGLTIVGVAAGIAIRRIASAGLIFRHQFLVTCPLDSLPASVRVDSLHAAATAWRGRPQVQLTRCSRWPERAGCDQACAAQFTTTPEDYLARTILAKWYDGKYCVCCGNPVGEAYWDSRKPALLTSGNVVEECDQIPIEELPKTLETARPVCFTCYVDDKVNRHPAGLGSQPNVGPGKDDRRGGAYASADRLGGDH